MAQYSDIPLSEFANLARASSEEIGAHGSTLWDHETGRHFEIGDANTALFLASARGIVMELVLRVIALEGETGVGKTIDYLYGLVSHPGTIQIEVLNRDFEEYDRLVKTGYLEVDLLQPGESWRKAYRWTHKGFELARLRAQQTTPAPGGQDAG